MSMAIRIKVVDLTIVAKHLASLSFDKTESEASTVTVKFNYLKATGDLYDTEVCFSRYSSKAIAEICMTIGIPFIYS